MPWRLKQENTVILHLFVFYCSCFISLLTRKITSKNVCFIVITKLSRKMLSLTEQLESITLDIQYSNDRTGKKSMENFSLKIISLLKNYIWILWLLYMLALVWFWISFFLWIFKNITYIFEHSVINWFKSKK